MTLYEIGRELRTLRRAADKLQQDIEDSHGIAAVTISRVEHGNRDQTRFNTIETYAHALGYELKLVVRKEGKQHE